jgi:hypothetical protein
VTEDDDNEPPEIEGVDSDDLDSADDNEPPETEGVQTICPRATEKKLLQLMKPK